MSIKRKEKHETSKNEKALKIMGLRNDGKPCSMLFEPQERGYICPLCRHNPNFDEEEPTLEWSEYNGFVWCMNCNIDMPSCICKRFAEPNIVKTPLPLKIRIQEMTRIFLDTVEEIKKHVSQSTSKKEAE